ncbi:hypothetical protein BDQ12DRAFT_674097 [Crucibulum laeve]|uniref:Uncharacterized protein n=1 Tax=Crucibulum laeve TaxID=68775 RepID=A0A5C3MIR2_9AGAR|nr:hypothetical protein BDQ12DRAFT_674097 [Crucibulum laeve]
MPTINVSQICCKKQLSTTFVPSKTRARRRLRPLTLVSGLVSKTSCSSDGCQPSRSWGSFSSHMSVVSSSKKEDSNSSGGLETSDNDASHLASTPTTSLSSHTSLPVGRRSLDYLQEGKSIVSPSNRSSVLNVVKKVEVAKEKEMEREELDEPLEKKDVITVIHRPEKIWCGRSVASIREEEKFERLLKEATSPSSSKALPQPPPTPLPTCPLTLIPMSAEKRLYSLPPCLVPSRSAPEPPGHPQSPPALLSPSNDDFGEPPTHPTPIQHHCPSSPLSSSLSLRSTPPTPPPPPSSRSATSPTTTSLLREKVSASEHEASSSSSLDGCEIPERCDSPPPVYTVEEVSAIPRPNRPPRRRRPEAICLKFTPPQSTRQDPFTPVPMRERRVEMAAQRSDSWNPPTPTPLRRTPRLMLLDYENEESEDDDDDHEVQVQFRQEYQLEEYEEYQQDDEIEYTQRKIRWSPSTSSLPQMDNLYENNDFTRLIPKHGLLTPLRSCLRVRNSTHIVLPSASVASFDGFTSVNNNFSDYLLPSRWSDDTAEDYLRRRRLNMIEKTLEWITSFTKSTVGWLRGLRLSAR